MLHSLQSGLCQGNARSLSDEAQGRCQIPCAMQLSPSLPYPGPQLFETLYLTGLSSTMCTPVMIIMCNPNNSPTRRRSALQRLGLVPNAPCVSTVSTSKIPLETSPSAATSQQKLKPRLSTVCQDRDVRHSLHRHVRLQDSYDCMLKVFHLRVDEGVFPCSLNVLCLFLQV